MSSFANGEALSDVMPATLTVTLKKDDDSLSMQSDNASIVSRASAGIASVLSQSLQILQGELPTSPDTSRNDIPEPMQTISFGQVPMEFSHEDDDEIKVSIDFLQDEPKDMTVARRIALALMNKTWYNPRAQEDSSIQPEATEVMEDVDATHGNFVESNDSDIVVPQDDTNDNDNITVPPLQENVKAYPDKVTQVEKPSLERAWAYFDHVALPRWVVETKPDAPRKNLLHRMVRKCFCKAGKTLDRAEPGENHFPTKLYSPIFTPLSQMGDFGLGVGLYFSTLRAITVLTLLAGLVNIPNFIYYSSNSYSLEQPNVHSLLQGSAICTNQVWVPCPECTSEEFQDNLVRLANITTDNNDTLVFALRNDCEGVPLQQGMVNYATLIFVLFGIVVMNAYQRHMEIKYDEDEQTAQDYSIIITNPPPDATNPEEWKAYFRDTFNGAHTTTCTIAVDNDFLVRSLLERRECFRKMEMLLEPGTCMDDLNLACIAAGMERERSFFGKLLACVVPGIPELFGKVTVLTARVQGLAQQDYPASNVFISFETEAAQRAVLTALSVGSIAASRNKIKAVAPQYLFRGELLLNVHEPDEPSTVRWQDLNAKFPERMKHLLTTTAATCGAIIAIFFLIRVVDVSKPAWTAITIAAANSIFPMFAKFLTDLEAHASEGGKQTSLYFKIALFRWVNTAIIITVVTPFTKTIDNYDGLIRQIYAIFFAEIVTTNAIQLLDPMGHIQRHFLAPRAATQDLMNLNMQGQVFELAERYTNMTKILFLSLWYCSIYPATLFMCSFYTFINFFTDRFSLMRTWKRAPALGTTISKFSRRYFFSTAIVAMAVVSSYYWSGFPFDNLCSNEDDLVDSSYYGTWNITTVSLGRTYSVTVDVSNDVTFRYCLQDLYRTSGRNFPAIPQFQPAGGEWMTEDQEKVTTLYGWTSVGVLAGVALSFVWGWYQSFRGLFRSTYEPNGDDQEVNFSDVPSISTYVPQVASTVYSYPLFACNIDGIDEDLFDWTDPDRPRSFYDLTKDAEELLRGLDVSQKRVFSTIHHWPPEKRKKTKKND